MYRLDFYNVTASDGPVLYSLGPEELSAQLDLDSYSVTSFSYFATKARALSIECFIADWLTTNLMNDEHELGYNICTIGVRLYRSDTGAIVFTGFVDTSSIVCDYADKIIRFTCYDALVLLSRVTGIKKLFSQQQGYTPWEILNSLISAIGDNVGVSVALDTTQPAVPDILNASNLSLLTVNITQMLVQADNHPQAPTGNDYVQNPPHRSTARVFCGWASSTASPILVAYVQVNWITGSGSSQRDWTRGIGKCWCFYNAVAPLEYDWLEADYSYGWFNPSVEEGWTKVENQALSWAAFLGVDLSSSPLLQTTINGRTWSVTGQNLANRTVLFSGQLATARFFPTGYYEQSNQQTDCLGVLKACMLAHNLTMLVNPQGVLQLVSKAWQNNTVHRITEAELLEMQLSRQACETPDTGQLEYFCGDTTIWQEQIAIWYRGILPSRNEITALVPEDIMNNPVLFDLVQIGTKQYRIISIKPEGTVNGRFWRFTARELL